MASLSDSEVRVPGELVVRLRPVKVVAAFNMTG